MANQPLLTSDEHFHDVRRATRAVDVVRSAPVAALMLVAHPTEQQRAVVERFDAGRCVRIKWTPIFGPSDELEGRICLNEAAHYAREAQRQVLDGGRVGNTGGICVYDEDACVTGRDATRREG